MSTTLNRTQIATVTALTLLYGVASLVHFAHNAESAHGACVSARDS